MDLILWRHAEAEEGADDLKRALTAKGRRHAAAMAIWLQRRLPENTLLLTSEALRSQQTMAALSERFDVVPDLNPGADYASVLAAAGWPERRGAVLIVGHQPTLGAAISFLLAGSPQDWTVRKGAVWWLCNRQRREQAQTLLKAMQIAELL